MRIWSRGACFPSPTMSARCWRVIKHSGSLRRRRRISFPGTIPWCWSAIRPVVGGWKAGSCVSMLNREATEPVITSMPPVLLADIGATNCRFGAVGADGRPERVFKLRGDAVASAEAAITRYLDEASLRPRAAVLAVAGPIEGDTVTLTNRAWSFRLSEMAAHFGWTAARCVNDFEAVAWSVQRLTADDVRPLGPAMPRRAAPGWCLAPAPGS